MPRACCGIHCKPTQPDMCAASLFREAREAKGLVLWHGRFATQATLLRTWSSPAHVLKQWSKLKHYTCTSFLYQHTRPTNTLKHSCGVATRSRSPARLRQHGNGILIHLSYVSAKHLAHSVSCTHSLHPIHRHGLPQAPSSNTHNNRSGPPTARPVTQPQQ